MMKVGMDADSCMSLWQMKTQAIAVLQIGANEAAAAMNLASLCSKKFVDILQSSVGKYGMHRGPISHEALSNRIVGLG
eukprot:452763-Alexandrium_andersonii.AAC.1